MAEDDRSGNAYARDAVRGSAPCRSAGPPVVPDPPLQPTPAFVSSPAAAPPTSSAPALKSQDTRGAWPGSLRTVATLFAGPEASLEIGDGPAAPGAAYSTMRLRVGGNGIKCDIDSFWFRDDLLALAALLRTLRDDPDALEGREVDGQRGPGLRVLRVRPDDPQLVQLWATASMDDPAVGVTFWLYYDGDAELTGALTAVEATVATLAE